MLVSAIGQSSHQGVDTDAWGTILQSDMVTKGMRLDGLILRRGIEGEEGPRTAVCNLTLNEKADLAAGVADMDIVETITGKEVSRSSQYLLSLAIVDSPPHCRRVISSISKDRGSSSWMEI